MPDLESLYADFYRTAGDIQRVAELAGLDPTKLALQGQTPAVGWHYVLTLAAQENRMSDLYAIVRKEHPRNEALPAAWAAYEELANGATKGPREQRRSHPPAMSDNYRTDNRIDALQREVSDLRALVAKLETSLDYLRTQNATIMRMLDEQNNQSELPLAFQWYIAGFVAIVLVVFAIVYFGGHA